MPQASNALGLFVARRAVTPPRSAAVSRSRRRSPSPPTLHRKVGRERLQPDRVSGAPQVLQIESLDEPIHGLGTQLDAGCDGLARYTLAELHRPGRPPLGDLLPVVSSVDAWLCL